MYEVFFKQYPFRHEILLKRNSVNSVNGELHPYKTTQIARTKARREKKTKITKNKKTPQLKTKRSDCLESKLKYYIYPSC